MFVTSKDGLKLHGLWVPAKDPKATVLLAHGYRSTMLIDFGKVLKLYHNMGVNLLLPEQRSHGKSQGKARICFAGWIIIIWNCLIVR